MAAPGATVERAIVFEQVTDYRRVSAQRCLSAWPVLFPEVVSEVDLGLRMAGPILFVVVRLVPEALTPEVEARFDGLVERCGGVEVRLGELSKAERANFLTRVEQCVHLRPRLSLEQVVPAFEAMFAIVDRVTAATPPDRRQAPRYPVFSSATLRPAQGPPVEVEVENVSIDGAYLRTNTPAPVGGQVKVELRLPAATVEAEATVVNERPGGYGVRFTPTPATERALVENITVLAPRPRPAPSSIPLDALLEPAVETSSPEEDPMPRLGDYELISLLGKGGRGEIFFARGVAGARAGRFVAIKRLTARLANDDAAIRALLAEAQTLSLIEHPAIVKLLEAGTFDGQPCLVMEALDARDLGQLLRRARTQRFKLPVDCAVYAARTLLEALAAVHGATSKTGERLEVAHCDVAPHNVFVSRSGQLKLGDFGSVRRVGERVKGLAQQARPTYLSPEGLDGEVSVQLDLWAAAVTAYELVTLELPFSGDSIEALSAAIRAGQPRRLRALRPEAPAGLELVLSRALSPRKEERFPSAAEFALALGVHLDPEKGNPGAFSKVVRTLFPERSWKSR